MPARKPPTLANEGPLDGLRFAVKDVFEIEGLRLTVGNRAFCNLSQRAGATAPLLQKLIDSGAHLVGTLTLGSLIPGKSLQSLLIFMHHSIQEQMDTSQRGAAVVEVVRLLLLMIGSTSQSEQIVSNLNLL